MLKPLPIVDAVALRRTVKKLPPAVAEPATALGHAATGGALGGAYAGALALLGRRGRRAATSSLVAYAISSGLSNGPLKWLARRPRPRGPMLAGLRRRGTRPATSSFPSSHTASAMAFAVAASLEYPAVAPVVLPTAAAVAISRLRAVRHYPTDVLAGIALGCAVGAAVVWRQKRRHAVTPTPDGSTPR